jgi:carbamoyl-phosphate synthase large subunit
VLIDKALMGWKEYELERDKNDNVVIICSIENMDPMGFILEIHNGSASDDSPTRHFKECVIMQFDDA